MRVDLLIHLDRVPEGNPNFVWWAESDDVPGFSAAADHLPDLLSRSYEALEATHPEESIELIPRFAARTPAEAEIVQIAGAPLDGLELRDSVALVLVPA